MPPAPQLSATTVPSSSRMLASYLTDIEQLLEEQHWDAALREACDLPRIAVALSDPQLRCSGNEVGMWCAQWMAGAESRSQPAQPEPQTSVAEDNARESVPTGALRRLQLRRHVRTPPRGYAPASDAALAPQEAQSIETGRALIGAARRWYARSGCHDLTVQTNLARLAVLR
jgi:hypothetical protein